MGWTALPLKSKKYIFDFLPTLLLAGLVVIGLILTAKAPKPILIYPFTAETWQSILNLSGQDKISPKTAAVIIPHDIVARQQLTQFYRGLSSVIQPSVVVVISPNHYESGAGDIQTTLSDFDTSDGQLQASNFASKLVRAKLAEVNSSPFVKEHGVTIQAEYIKHFFKSAKIVPIILKQKTSPANVEKLASWLKNNLPEGSLVIASIDFSHYLPKAQADINDSVTLAQILSRDINKLPKSDAKCAFLDSPASLRVVVQYANLSNAGVLKIVRHDNSASIIGMPNLLSTTSHFYITFSQS
jgi:hypothetical protein